MNAPLTPLGDLIEIKHGFAFKGEHFDLAGKYVLLTPGNCRERGGLLLKGAKEKYYVGDVPDGYILSQGALLVVMTDLVNTAPILGGAFFIPEDDRFLHNQRLGLITIKHTEKLDKEFAFYALNSETYRAQVRGSASGATVRHTSPGRIYQCKIPLPSLRTQRRIVETLKPYDDLIANNEQRVALLEQSARLLFAEWFVRLRYPGSEGVESIDGVPEGWERRNLGDVAPLHYGKALTEAMRVPGGVAVYGSSGDVGSHNKRLVNAPGIVVGRKGNVGSTYWVSRDFWPIDTTYYVGPEHVSLFIYHLLQTQAFSNSDAAVPGLNRDYAHGKKLLWPPKNLRHSFEAYASPMFEQRDALLAANCKLVQARDLLLPRLMDARIAA